jgi:pimeloyl-ACP methyl ester carboxylesterase
MNQPTVDLRYSEIGTGTGSPLVLVHGFPLDRTIWDEVAAILAPSMRVIMPDLRGYGQSPVTGGVYSMRLLADDLAALLDKLNLGKVVLAGHSMGGYVAQTFAKAYSKRLAGLAMVTSQATADQPDRKEGRLKLAGEVEKRGTIAVVEASLAKYSSNPDVLERTKAVMMKVDPLAVAGSLRGMAEREDMTGYLPKVKIPALVIGGEADELIPAKKSEEMAGLLPNGRLVIVPGGGHMVMWEAPQVVAQAMADLVQQI